MDYKELYEFWKNNEFFDEETRAELAAITDEKEIEERFYKELEFGTAGLRGIMGAGTNRYNRYIVRRASCGMGLWVGKRYGEDGKKRGIAIAYDVRNGSDAFAKEAALAIIKTGVKVYLFSTISPTPLLSYTVRRLGCAAGIVITASHNTKEYNGYKAYNQEGCQVYLDESDELMDIIAGLDITKVELADEAEAVKNGMLVFLDQKDIDAWTDDLQKFAHPVSASAKADLKIVYTAIHGSGNLPVRKVLSEQGFSNVTIVKEQELPDGNFPTVASPNPENPSALEMAVAKAKECGADLLFGTDPDSDRIGIAVLHDGDYRIILGNQTGYLLAYYMFTRAKDIISDKSLMVTTVVTSELGPVIARDFGVKVAYTLTGFKFIGKIMGDAIREGWGEPLLGYEESYGYLVGTYARDKDAASAAMMVCEMAAYYKEQGKTLVDVLNEIYAKYGYYLDVQDSYYMTGKEGAQRIKDIASAFRNMGAGVMDGIVSVKDYSLGIDDIPKSNVLKFFFADGTWTAVRPSGTEPKLKLYHSIKGKNEAEAKQIYEKRKAAFEKIINC